MLAALMVPCCAPACICDGGARPRTDSAPSTASPPAVTTARANAGGSPGPTGSTTTAGEPRAALDTAAGPSFCDACGEARLVGTLEELALSEASGLVASARHPGVYYVHNDSGDRARFFAIDEAGAALASFELRGAKASDWEDVSIGPCPAGDCIYLADFGDNYEVRSDYALYRVAEPPLIEPGVHGLSFERIPFEYPDGHHNAETLLIHPNTGEVVVVTKVAWGMSAAYRFPQPLTVDVTMTLQKVAELTPPLGTALLTGGDVHPAGVGLLLRSYTDLFYGPLRDGTIVSALLGELCAVPVATEEQGETVAWTATGDGWLTVSEGEGSPLYRTRCGVP